MKTEGFRVNSARFRSEFFRPERTRKEKEKEKT